MLIFASLYAVYLFGFSILAISVTAIELIIYWNHINGEYEIKSTAQVFSLIIGAGGLWRVLYQIVLARVEKRKVFSFSITALKVFELIFYRRRRRKRKRKKAEQ